MINICLLEDEAAAGPHPLADVAACIAAQLSQAGLHVISSRNGMAPELLNVVLGAGLPGTMPLDALRMALSVHRAVIFNTAPLAGPAPVDAGLLALLRDHIVWDSCPARLAALAALAQQSPTPVRAHEFPLLPSTLALFHPLPPVTEDRSRFAFDYACTSPLASPSAVATVQALLQRGLRLKLLPGASGAALAEELGNCRGFLDLHEDGQGALDIPRLLRPMALGLPILSEASGVPQGVDWPGSGILFAPPEKLVASAAALLRAPRVQHAALRKMLNFLHDPRWPALAREVAERSAAQLEETR